MATENEIYERFKRETSDHTMTILRDEGLYRHLRFRQPRNEVCWFDLITVPGALIFQGDGETFAFRRTEDMFAFFRGPVGRINPDYWSEKLTSSPGSVTKYSMDAFERQVAGELNEAEASFPGVTKAWAWHIDGEYNTEYEHDAREALHRFRYRPEGALDEFYFVAGEWDLTDYYWWFLWACHAIVWGIAQYDARTAEAVSLPAGAVAS